jgi:phosphoserine phosphatase
LSEASQARKDVDEARERVSQQRRLIKLLREAGRDTWAASSTLTSMLETLRLLEKDEQQLEDERYRAA